jgi:hypothetical protein
MIPELLDWCSVVDFLPDEKMKIEAWYMRDSNRPWLYPVNEEPHMKILVKRPTKSAKRGIELRVLKDFKNEGLVPTNSVTTYTTFSKKRLRFSNLTQ